MAKYCENCGKKFPLLYKPLFGKSSTLCKECKILCESELSNLEKDIIRTKKFEAEEQQLKLIRKADKNSLIDIYSKIYIDFEADKELDEEEIEALQKFQEAFDLSDEEIQFNERVKPYIYVNNIRKEDKLPTLKLTLEGGSPLILKKGEILHHADRSNLQELRSVRLGYSGGSRGVSIRIAKGLTYRAGAHRGHVVKEDRYVETSQGILLVSNQRLFLHPLPGNKPLSLPLKKILSYHCYKNGIEVYKEGREKGYFFGIDDSGSVEIFGICLSHLLAQ
jgi:hypothetical protein